MNTRSNSPWGATLPLKSLRSTPPKQRLNGWWLEHAPGQSNATGIIGAFVHTAAGKTSSVIDIDAETRRVKTKSGTIYELGLPDTAFARENTRLLRELGLT